MTALLILEAVERGEMSLDQMVTASAGAVNAIPWYGSSAGIKAGEQMRLKDLLYCMMLVSANEACNIVAEAAAGSVDAFVARMNTRAQELGMVNTHFTNTNGLHDPDHYTTMEDLATLGLLIPNMPEGLNYTNLPSDQIALDETRILDWKNTNALIHPESEFYCSAAVGLKTGQHPAAGKCLLSAFRFNGKTVLIGVFGCADDPERFADTLQLLQLCT
jgi:D-alanyl-D-alanine carboxypeptidase (penicillin-binding protein 5/6)